MHTKHQVLYEVLGKYKQANAFGRYLPMWPPQIENPSIIMLPAHGKRPPPPEQGEMAGVRPRAKRLAH